MSGSSLIDSVGRHFTLAACRWAPTSRFTSLPLIQSGKLKEHILLVQGGVLVIAVAYVFINLVTDLVQNILDPRIRQT